jgi:hypothetical protein
MTIEFDELRSDNRSDDDTPGRGRRRMIAAVGAVMLVAAAAGAGYGIGHNVDRDAVGSTSSDSGDDEAASTAETAVPSTRPLERSAEPATTEYLDDASSTSLETGDVDLGSVGGATIGASGGPGYAGFGTQPMELLFERTTESGLQLRAQLGQIWDGDQQVDWGAGDWRPAPWCYESAQLRVSMTGNGIVDVGGVPWYAEAFRGRSVSWLLLGGNDGSPQWVVVVQAPVDTANVRVQFADGATDQAVPQGGLAVLTVPGQPSTPVTEDGYTYWMDPIPDFEVSFDGGAEPVTVGSDGVGNWNDPEFRRSCSPPPPALPEPGEQPADPVTAEAEIRTVVSSLYGVVATDQVGSDLIDDPTGVAEAREQVQAGVYAEDAASATAAVEELVFTTPTEAWFRYSIDTAGNDFYDRYGMAVAVDGIWKVTRATVCQDLSLAGGDCGPGWEPIFPPDARPTYLED